VILTLLIPFHACSGSEDGLCPAYVRDCVGGQIVWRLMQAQGAPSESSPRGFGDGSYRPLPTPKNVVAIVGTAHVQGITRRWNKVLEELEQKSKTR
jgi:hypothetical protein